jgi:hypothetical protein
MRCFYPTRAQALSESATTTIEDARLPRSAISFFHPCPADDNDYGDTRFSSLGRSSNSFISMDQDGNTLLYDAASRAMPAPKPSPISIPVGGSLYLLNRNPGPQEEYHPFEALVPRAGCLEEGWRWRSHPPPFSFNEDCDYDYNKAAEVGPTRCYVIKAYSVVGGSQIWVSTMSGGTYSLDTESGVWSKAGDWALPFCGRVQYAPELGIWLGFSYAACRL